MQLGTYVTRQDQDAEMEQWKKICTILMLFGF